MSRVHGLQKVHQKSERQQELRANRRRLTRELRGGIAGAIVAADEFEDLLATDLPEKEFHRQLQAGEVVAQYTADRAENDQDMSKE